ncbi:MAG: helix-hairpin-helix domain-containing protein [Nannocystaceae bacterium]|nr:helix-hairpin-helix domain-containing protein [Nannocystaceae bacterium]
MPRPEWAPWGLVVLAVLATAWSLSPTRRDPVESLACDAFALVEGRLVCADKQTFEGACGARHSLRAGDALEGCGVGRMAPDDLAALGVRVDPNEAAVSELQSLPGVGPVLAERIVQGRPYSDAEALLDVHGVGPRTLAQIKPRLSLPDPGP